MNAEIKKIRVFNSVRRVEGESSYSNSMFHLMKRNEEIGFNGILFFENHSNDIDPWVFAQELFARTQKQSPFIAVNPAYIHPYSAALKILSLTNLYKRKLYLNFIIGTSKSDLLSIGDKLPHSERYERLKEYIQILSGLLKADRMFNFEGRFYTIRHARLPLGLDINYFPEFFISGSSSEADTVREMTGSGKIVMAKPLGKCIDFRSKGLCCGIIARANEPDAKEYLTENYRPIYAEYKELVDFSLNNSDAVWKQELIKETNDGTFYSEPFKHFISDSPYLVGSYLSVADYICKYIGFGIDTFIIESDDNELEHIAKVFDIVEQKSNIN